MVASENRGCSATTPATSASRRSERIGSARGSAQFCGRAGAAGVASADCCGGSCPMRWYSRAWSMDPGSTVRAGAGGGRASSACGLGRIAAPTSVLTVFAVSQAAANSSARFAVQAYLRKKRSSMGAARGRDEQPSCHGGGPWWLHNVP
jgi:hypothetical protein